MVSFLCFVILSTALLKESFGGTINDVVVDFKGNAIAAYGNSGSDIVWLNLGLIQMENLFKFEIPAGYEGALEIPTINIHCMKPALDHISESPTPDLESSLSEARHVAYQEVDFCVGNAKLLPMKTAELTQEFHKIGVSMQINSKRHNKITKDHVNLVGVKIQEWQGIHNTQLNKLAEQLGKIVENKREYTQFVSRALPIFSAVQGGNFPKKSDKEKKLKELSTLAAELKAIQIEFFLKMNNIETILSEVGKAQTDWADFIAKVDEAKLMVKCDKGVCWEDILSVFRGRKAN